MQEGPSKAAGYVAVFILGLVAGAVSIPALWLVIVFALHKSLSSLEGRDILYVVALIDTVFCVRLFRWSHLFIVSFALAAIVSLVYCTFLLFLSEAVPD